MLVAGSEAHVELQLEFGMSLQVYLESALAQKQQEAGRAPGLVRLGLKFRLGLEVAHYMQSASWKGCAFVMICSSKSPLKKGRVRVSGMGQ